MAKRRGQTQAQVVVSNLTHAQARTLVLAAIESKDRVTCADAVHDVLNSGTGWHAWRASGEVRLADKVVLAGDVLRMAASAFDAPLPGEPPTAHFVRVGLGAWKHGQPGMVRCKGSWKPANEPQASTF
jgi:hypothetical protein